MEEDKFKDLLEDEELTSLRLAALATKRKKEQEEDNLTNSASALPINSIVTSSALASESASNQIPFVQSDRNAYNNSYSWRKQSQMLRRRGGPFPKNNTRSNLIVINPVSLSNDKDLGDKPPALVLPQHKWCASGNEDSMSPKTLRKTGPTRFNRHGSDSETSDSEFENENDSESNETVLQDEPAEHFSRLSPGSDTISDGIEKKRRFSFQNLDSEIKSDTFDKSETTCIYNLLKNPSYDCSDNKSDNYGPIPNQNDGRHVWNHSAENDYDSYKQFSSGNAFAPESLESTEKFVGKQNDSLNGECESYAEANKFITQSSDACTWQHADIKTTNPYYPKEASSVFESSRSHGTSDRKPKNYSEKRQISSEIQNSDNTVWQHGDRVRSNKSFFPRENAVDSRNYKDGDVKMQFLSEGDLRFELKKRNLNQEIKSTGNENHGEKEENIYDQTNVWDRNTQENSYEGNINDVPYENKHEISNFQRSRNEQSFIGEGSEYNSNLNGKQQVRSQSSERNKQDSFSTRERSRLGYNSGPERSRRDRSSSPCRNRDERSSSRGRSRRSSSRSRRRFERSSSQGRIKHEIDQDTKRSRSGFSFSEKKDEHSSIGNKNCHEHNFTEEKNRHEYNSSQSKSRYDRSFHQYRSRREHSSSSDSRHEHSSSQDRELHSYQSRRKRVSSFSQNKKRYERSSSRERIHSPSQERNKREHSLSRDRSRHRSSESQDSKHRSSSSQGESDERHSPSQGRHYFKHSSRGMRSTYKKHNSGHYKSSHDSISSQDKDRYGCVFGQDTIKDSNTTSEVRISLNIHKPERGRENSKFEKEDLKSTVEQNESHDSSEEKKQKGSIISLVKHNSVKDSLCKIRYSRSRSSSSTSSSSSSSSSFHKSKPKLRSVTSVVKYAPTKSSEIPKEETLGEMKSVGKNINLNIFQSDISLTSSRKNIDVGTHKLTGFKCSRVDVDFKASDNTKRVPVHMRLGVLPRKRVIQMPKDVEAAFVNSSSSSDGENVNTKCKRQNIRIVTDVCGDKSGLNFEKRHLSTEKSKRSPDLSQEKAKRLKIKS